MHGGGTGQFAAVPLNLSFLSKVAEQPEADYVSFKKCNYPKFSNVLNILNFCFQLVTGTWSQKAAKEAEKYLKVNKVFTVLRKI